MRKREGTCFEDAFKIAMDHRNEDPVIVHGIPKGMGGEARGLRYWHAWVEVGDVVYAPLEPGEAVAMVKDIFYRLGRIDPDHCHTFDDDAAVDAMLRYKHFGPWVGDDEEEWEAVLRRSYPDVPTEYDEVARA